MKIKKPIYVEYNLDALVGDSKPIRITHIEDNEVDVLELCVRQGGQKINLSNTTVTARIVLHGKKDILLNDNVACAISNGNALIPFDNAVLKSYKGIWKIEVNIKRDTEVLTLPHPLWVMVNDTILATAEISPESEGTVPELLKKVEEELKRVQGYVDMDKLFDTLDDTLSGDSSLVPALFVKPKGDNYALVYVDSNDEEHELFDFANLPSSGGTADYNNLENKPQINGQVLDGNKTSNELGLQKKLTAGTNITIGNDGTISASGGTTDYNELENKPQIDGIPIEKNQGHEAYNLFGLSTPISWMLNFSDLVDMPSKNGILNTTIHQVKSLPKFMNPKDKHFIIFDYQAESQGIWDIAVWIDAVTNEPKMAFRAGTNNIYSVSDWVELTSGSQIVSGVVNAQGHIEFTDSDGNTFTTTGESVIGPQGVPGRDYVLTAQDKTDIANIVLSELPTTQGVLYGNTSN